MGARRQPWEPRYDTIAEDLVRLAEGRNGRNVPMSARQYAALKAGRQRAKKARVKAAREMREILKPAPHTKRNAKGHAIADPGHVRVVDRIMNAMEPGQWHGLYALGRVAGAWRNTVARMGQMMRARGWATRVPNPAWDPDDNRPPWQMLSAHEPAREPKWLYQITLAGIAERRSPGGPKQGQQLLEHLARDASLDQDHSADLVHRKDIQGVGPTLDGRTERHNVD